MFVINLILSVLLFSNLSLGSSASDIDRIIRKSRISPNEIGLILLEGDELLTWNSKKLLQPASLTKIITAAAVMDHFKPSDVIETKIYYTGEIVNEVLKGNLYIKGFGDPSLVSEDFWAIANQLVRKGFQSIQGDLVIDQSYFLDDGIPMSRKNRSTDRAYNAPISALSFNWNAATIYVNAKKRMGSAEVYVDPENNFVEIVNKSKLANRRNLRVSRVKRDNKDAIFVKGTFPKSGKEKAYYKSITRPSLWAGENFKSFLLRRGIRISGAIKEGVVSKSAKELLVYKGKSISAIVKDMMKFSNNYVAEMLTSLLSTGEKKSLISGVTEIKKWLEKAGVTGEYVLTNPSGLTNKNKFTAEQLLKVLNYVSSSFAMKYEYLAALPISGLDGTLKKRMKNIPLKVRAKTGYLSGVVGLAGFYESAGREQPFVYMYNGEPEKAEDARALIDEILTYMVKK